MAPKRPTPLDHPPAASSSEEEEEQSSSEEEGSGEEEEEEEEESSSGEGDDEDDVVQTQEKRAPPPAKPASAAPQKQDATKKPQQKSPPPTSDSESESESESEPEPDPEAQPRKKPFAASKPMDETPKKQKSKAKSVVTPPKPPPPPPKRSAQSGAEASKELKRPKKGDENDGKHSGEDSKKQLFQRLWSEEDEIAILRGMIDYKSKTGANPSSDIDAFYDSVKKLIRLDATKLQVQDKVRRLKKKYENNAGKEESKGEGKLYLRPHERLAFDLSKKIWGSDSAIPVANQAKANGTSRKTQKAGKSAAAPNAELLIPSPEAGKAVPTRDKVAASSAEAITEFVVKTYNALSGEVLSESFIREALETIKEPKKSELEERWRKLQWEEWELGVKKMELLHEHAKCVMAAQKSI